MFSFLITFINVPREESANSNGNTGPRSHHSMEMQGRDDTHRDLTQSSLQIEYLPKLRNQNKIM